MEMPIEHDEVNQTFFCTVNEMTNSVQYERKNTSPVILDIYRTFVHPEMRGKGIAELLLKRISEYAVTRNFTILPSCSYAVTFFRRHREFESILARGVDLEEGGSCRLK